MTIGRGVGKGPAQQDSLRAFAKRPNGWTQYTGVHYVVYKGLTSEHGGYAYRKFVAYLGSLTLLQHRRNVTSLTPTTLKGVHHGFICER